MAQQSLGRLSGPGPHDCGQVAVQSVQAAGEGVGGHSPLPHEPSQPDGVQVLPVDRGERLAGEQKVRGERVRRRFVPVPLCVGELLVVVAPDEVAQLMRHRPVLPEPVPGRRERDHAVPTCGERVRGGQVGDPHDIDAEPGLQLFCEGPHEILTQRRSDVIGALRKGRCLLRFGVGLPVREGDVAQHLLVGIASGYVPMTRRVVEPVTRGDDEPMWVRLSGDQPMDVRIQQVGQARQLD